MRLAYLYLIFITLLDYLTTHVLVARQGFEIEANPFLRYLITTVESTYPILVIKLITVVVYGLALYTLKVYYPQRYALPVWTWVTVGIDMLLTGIVIGAIVLIMTK